MCHLKLSHAGDSKKLKCPPYSFNAPVPLFLIYSGRAWGTQFISFCCLLDSLIGAEEYKLLNRRWPGWVTAKSWTLYKVYRSDCDPECWSSVLLGQRQIFQGMMLSLSSHLSFPCQTQWKRLQVKWNRTLLKKCNQNLPCLVLFYLKIINECYYMFLN